MQKVQAARPNRGVLVRFLMLLVVFGSMAALLVWLKLALANSPQLYLPSKLQDFLTLALCIVVEAVPFVVLGALVSVLIRLIGPIQRLIQLLPKRALLRRRLSISLLGTFMPVCECGNVPVARGLVIRGLSVGESITFLLAAPIINPVTLLSTSQAFRVDPSIVWLRMAGALVIANLVVGALISLHKNLMELLSKGFYNTLCQLEDHHDHDHDDDHPDHNTLLTARGGGVQRRLLGACQGPI
ncbi:MAG: permease [Actinobacteria bacterium]|nr:permease [Actinomycetota bacterium]